MKTTRRDNRIILDIGKCSYARFYYRNQRGQTRNCNPENIFLMSVNNEIMTKDAMALFHPDYPNETCLKRAARLGIIDKWIPEVYFQVTAGCGVIYTGNKAVSMYDLWKAKIFGKKK